MTYEWKLLNQGGIVDKKINGIQWPVLKLGDLDNDNDLDLIYGSQENWSGIKVYKFDGKRMQLDNNSGINVSNVSDAEIGDVNGDGYSDVLINSFAGNNSGNLRMYIAQVQDSIVTGYNNINIDAGLYKAKGKIIDLNNDGQSEVVIVGLTSSNTTSGKPKFYIYEYNDNNSFEKIDLTDQIESLKNSSFDLGDVDNDQDIDFVITGFDENNGLKSYLYMNTTVLGGEHTLEKTDHDFAATRDGTLDLIDYDSDGDLDIVISGTGRTGDIFEIYANKLDENNTDWPRLNIELPGMRNGKIDLGDFDGDGYADLLYSGVQTGKGKITELREYVPSSNDYRVSLFDVSDIIDAEVEFGDIDGDDDLDFVLSGTNKNDENEHIFRGYLNVRNESANFAFGAEEHKDDLMLSRAPTSQPVSQSSSSKFKVNRPPTKPLVNEAIILDDVQTVDGNVSVEFSWNSSTDDWTSETGLTYSLRIGTSPGSDNIMSSGSNKSGKRKVPEKGNAEHNLKWKVSLKPGTYYWSVQVY